MIPTKWNTWKVMAWTAAAGATYAAVQLIGAWTLQSAHVQVGYMVGAAVGFATLGAVASGLRNWITTRG